MKAVFFDVDGTLIDCVEKKIPASSIKAIEELRKNGYKVALATGRDINSIRDIKDLDISVFDAYVLNNGAAIYDNTLRCIKDFPFLREDVEKILEYCNNNNMSLIFDAVDGPYLATKITDFLVEGKKYYEEEIPPYIEWKGEEVVKINIFAPMGYVFSELEKDISARIVPCPTVCYDVMAKGISKQTGIREMMKYYGFNEDDYMAFGDQENDWEMLENAKIGIAVKDIDGSEKLQHMADYVCNAPRKDGIYTFLKNNGYI